MKKSIFFRIFGIIFLIFGLSVVFNSFQSITGFAVYGEVDLNKGYLIGAWFVITGILLSTYNKKEGNNERQP